MDSLNRRINEMNKTSIIPEPTETRLLIEDPKELQLHRTALKILGRNIRDIDNFLSKSDDSVYPIIDESEKAVVDESTRLILKRYLHLFKSFGNAYCLFRQRDCRMDFLDSFTVAYQTNAEIRSSTNRRTSSI